MDRDGLRVVPEATPGVAQDSAQPAGQGAPAGPAPGGHARTARRRRAFRALRSRPFRLYFAGQVASASGTFVQQTALGWLVLRLTRSPAELGLVLAAGGVPLVKLGQDYLPSRPGTAAGVTLGLAVSAGGLFMPILGLVADGHGPQGVFAVLALLPVIAISLSAALREPR